jgi:hypothetical protein
MLSQVLKTTMFVGAFALCACQTYQRDLDRAAAHYQSNRHTEALAVLEVLEPDSDSLSSAERARYAYFRGMANFRLEQRREARHWLGLAAAGEKLFANSLSRDEKERIEHILGELNKDRFGGATAAVAPAAAPVTPGGAAPATAPTAATRCGLDTDCVRGEYCDAGYCRKSEAPKAQ